MDFDPLPDNRPIRLVHLDSAVDLANKPVYKRYNRKGKSVKPAVSVVEQPRTFTAATTTLLLIARKYYGGNIRLAALNPLVTYLNPFANFTIPGSPF